MGRHGYFFLANLDVTRDTNQQFLVRCSGGGLGSKVSLGYSISVTGPTAGQLNHYVKRQFKTRPRLSTAVKVVLSITITCMYVKDRPAALFLSAVAGVQLIVFFNSDEYMYQDLVSI